MKSEKLKQEQNKIINQVNQINQNNDSPKSNQSDEENNDIQGNDIIMKGGSISFETNFNDKNNGQKNKIRNPNNNKKGKGFDLNNKKSVINKMNNQSIKLDDTRQYHIELLLRYICFEEKIRAKIKYYTQFQPCIETGYIINHKLIEHFKEFYNARKLISLFKQNSNLDMINKNYRKDNNYYINETAENDFIYEVLQNLPEEYRKEIQTKNNTQFLYDLQNQELYRLLMSYASNQQCYYYFPNCILINEILSQYLFSLIIDINEYNYFEKVNFMIANRKLILTHNLNIYLGYLSNNESMYIPEIMIYCQEKAEFEELCNELKSNQIEINIILQRTERENNDNPNIGIYNNTNIKVIILSGNYTMGEDYPNLDQNPIFQGGIVNIKKLQKQMEGLSLNVNQNMNGNNIQGNNGINQLKPRSYTKIKKDIKREIKNILYVLIDMKLIRKKMNISLNKDTEYEAYYPISLDWFMKYIEYYNISNIYNNKIIIQTIDNIIESSQNALTYEEIIQNAKLQKDFFNIIKNISMNMTKGNYISKTSLTPMPIYINDFYYYNKIILVSEATRNLFNIYESNSNKKPYPFYCYFGDNKIFVVNNGPKKYLIEVFYFDQYYNIIPEIIFKFYGGNELNHSFSLLKEKGFEQYIGYYSMFNDDKNNTDYVSPIFNQNNKEIGYVYKYHPNINNYSPYIINNEYKVMLILYFYYQRLHSQSIKKYSGDFYILVNWEFIKKYKDYYDYQTLEKCLLNNNFAQQIAKSIKEKQDYVLNDKIITIIIKNLPNNINMNFINKSKYKVPTGNILEEPNSKCVQNTELFYYDEFELIDRNLYSLIFKKSNIQIYGECYFSNGYICIKMPQPLNQKKTTSCILIFGSLNQNNIFKAKYLLEYNSFDNFKKNFYYMNAYGDFPNYINSFKFTNNNIEQLIDENNNNIGLIYNLHMAPPVTAQVPALQPKSLIHIPPIPPKEPFKYPPLIGLKNVRATCYMNATLQCLCQIQNFVKYFKNNQHVINTINKYKQENKACLSESFKYLIVMARAI